MIEELYIENFAIIEKTRVSFKEGLNVLSGETGAGKSIIIEAIELILGARADRDFVGPYGDRALVEASFYLSNEEKNKIHDKYGIDCSEGFIVTREITKEESSVTRINSRRVNLKILEEIMLNWVNIHGQNENYILNDKKNYIDIIDSFNDESQNYLREIKELFLKHNKVKKTLEDLDINKEELEREMDILSYQINEIELAKLDELDEDALVDEYKELSNASQIINSLNKAKGYYRSDSMGENDISDLVEKSLFELSKVKDFSKSSQSLFEEMENIGFLLEAYYENLQDSLISVDINDERISIIDEKFRLLEELKRKYGSNKDEILNFLDDAKKRLESFENKDKIIASHKRELKNIEGNIKNISSKLSSTRKASSKVLSKKINNELKKLNLANSKFEIEIKAKDRIDKTGGDDVDFLVSFNLGQAIKPISKIGSGGEISRFMLALKIVMAEYDKVDTLIFDEIDTGISGVTAARVGEALKDLSKNYQIILVTHLSQIAIQADNHILIDKYTEDKFTKSRLRHMNEEERVLEIARLIGGDKISNKTIETARELIEEQK